LERGIYPDFYHLKRREFLKDCNRTFKPDTIDGSHKKMIYGLMKYLDVSVSNLENLREQRIFFISISSFMRE
jgi:hypothetical protein